MSGSSNYTDAVEWVRVELLQMKKAKGRDNWNWSGEREKRKRSGANNWKGRLEN